MELGLSHFLWVLVLMTFKENFSLFLKYAFKYIYEHLFMFQALFQRLSKPHFHGCLKNISTIMTPTLGKRKLNHKELKQLLKAIQKWGEGRRFDQALDSKATILHDHHLLSARACVRQGIQGSQTDITRPNSLKQISLFIYTQPIGFVSLKNPS